MQAGALRPQDLHLLQRHAGKIRWLSGLLLIAGLLLLAQALPVEPALRAVMAHVERMGFWGPVAWGVLYVVATVLLLPASPFTILAGALFGPILGTITVSLASTTAAAIAFLIARYVARDKVAQFARGNLKFHAIDRAIAHGGWRVVALLRLSPAMPFNVGNYLFGLTGIRFWPYVLASWLCMLPGSFLFTYIGYLGREGISPADRTAGEWAMLVVGLLATVAATVYITRLATRAIRKEKDLAEVAAADGAVDDELAKPAAEPIGLPWKTISLAAAALLLFVAGVFAQMNEQRLRALFGPPVVELVEAYEPGGTAFFNHDDFDELLQRHVDEHGWVDYAGLQRDAEQLDQYIASLADAPFDEMGRDQKLALLINAYNAFTLRLILDHYPIASIRDIPAARRWQHQRWEVAGQTLSLDQIEHEQIRPNFHEPRIHFALVCAAIGCPPLRREAYRGDVLDRQLEEQTQYAHEHPRWFVFDDDAGVVHLTKLYDWYADDFEQAAESVLNFAARYSPQLAQALAQGRNIRVNWLEYDWALNDQAAAAQQ